MNKSKHSTNPRVLERGYSCNLPSFAMWTNPSIVMSIKDRILVHVVNVWPLAASLTLIQFTAVTTPEYIIDSEIFIRLFFGMWVMRGTGDREGLEKALRFECLYHLLVYSQYFETNKTSVVNHCHLKKKMGQKGKSNRYGDILRPTVHICNNFFWL